MKKRSKDPHILLMRSPFFLWGDDTGQWSTLVSAMACGAIHVQTFDVWLDYVQTDFSLYAEGMGTAQADHVDPLLILDRQKEVDSALSTVSTAFSPCLFHRHGFGHPGLNHEDDLKRFVQDTASNPFFDYADKHWRPFNPSHPPELAILYLETPGQMGPAATFAYVWQTRWPEIPIKLIGTRLLPKELLDRFSTLSRQWPAGTETIIDEAEKSIAADHGHTRRDTDAQVGVSAGLPQPLIAEEMPVIVRAALDSKCHFITWQWHGGRLDDVTKQLYAASRQGIWNHLVLDGRCPVELKDFAATNANIIHSYCYREDPLSTFSDPYIRYPSDPPGYGRTTPMPGQPLWMALKDPASIRMLLTRYDLKRLMRLRLRDSAGSFFEVGTNLSYHFKPPGDLPDGHLDEIVKMVEAGGSVNTRFVRHNLERAYLIAYVEEEGVIVGNSSLKHPRDEYIDAVSGQSGIDLHNFLERGYTSVRPEYRGLGVGAKLLEGLTERAGEYKIFSVIAESNIATQKMAIRNNTRRVATFFSQIAKKEMGVWIPQWMIPSGITLPEQPDPDLTGNPEKGSK